MTGRIDVGTARALDREAERMVDPPTGDLVPTHESGEDRQAGRIGGRPPGRAHFVRAQAPHGARAGMPSVERVHLVQLAARTVEHQRVPVASMLDLDVARDRVWPIVTLVRIV